MRQAQQQEAQRVQHTVTRYASGLKRNPPGVHYYYRVIMRLAALMIKCRYSWSLFSFLFSSDFVALNFLIDDTLICID